MMEMKPIFQKLQLDYEKELSQVELKAQSEESSLRSTFQNNLQEIVEIDERHAKDECRAATKHRDSSTNAQIEEMGYEHKYRKQQLIGIFLLFNILI